MIGLSVQERLASLRARQPANAEQPAGATVWKLTAEELATLQSMPVSELRQLAEQQHQKAQAAYEKETSSPWYYGLTAPGVLTDATKKIRYSPELKLLDDAQDQIREADKATEESVKRRHLVSALQQARVAAGSISADAQSGSTEYLIFIKPVVDWAGEKLKPLGEGLEVAMLVLVGLFLLGGGSR